MTLLHRGNQQQDQQSQERHARLSGEEQPVMHTNDDEPGDEELDEQVFLLRENKRQRLLDTGILAYASKRTGQQVRSSVDWM